MEATNNVSNELNIMSIFSPGEITIYIVGAILIAVVLFFIRRKGKRIKLSKINIGPIEVKVDDSKETTPVYSIAILKHPTSVSGNPAMLNTLKARVYDKDNNPLKNKRVTITVDGKENDTERYLSGQLSQVSDENGYVVFSGLTVLKRGSFCLTFRSDNVIAKARPFSVTPPGLDTNLENKVFGSDEYIDTLKLALSLSKGADKVEINGEEII